MKSRLTPCSKLSLACLLLALAPACASGDEKPSNPVKPSSVDAGDARADAGKPKPPVVDAGPATPPGPETPTPDAGPEPADAEPPAAKPLEKAWEFTTDTETWATDYASPEEWKAPTGVNPAHDAAEGDPKAGSLKLTIPFTKTDQKVGVAVNLDPPVNLTGKTVVARVKLASGLNANPSTPGGAKLFVKSGAGDLWLYADSGWNNLATADGWIELELKADAPGGYVSTSDAGAYAASSIRQIGIEVATGGVGAGWETAVVNIDTVGWR